MSIDTTEHIFIADERIPFLRAMAARYVNIKNRDDFHLLRKSVFLHVDELRAEAKAYKDFLEAQGKTKSNPAIQWWLEDLDDESPTDIPEEVLQWSSEYFMSDRYATNERHYCRNYLPDHDAFQHHIRTLVTEIIGRKKKEIDILRVEDDTLRFTLMLFHRKNARMPFDEEVDDIVDSPVFIRESDDDDNPYIKLHKTVYDKLRTFMMTEILPRFNMEISDVAVEEHRPVEEDQSVDEYHSVDEHPQEFKESLDIPTLDIPTQIVLGGILRKQKRPNRDVGDITPDTYDYYMQPELQAIREYLIQLWSQYYLQKMIDSGKKLPDAVKFYLESKDNLKYTDCSYKWLEPYMETGRNLWLFKTSKKKKSGGRIIVRVNLQKHYPLL